MELGDYPTPIELAREVCALLARNGVAPASIVEPTCGAGAFLRAAIDAFPRAAEVVGVELDGRHAEAARASTGARVLHADFFATDWERLLGASREPVLVVGNPPWVTNSAIGARGGSNLPAKSNFERRTGLDALTGKSNFDLSEAMLSRLIEALSGRRATVAVLCKLAVARKVLHRAWRRGLELRSAATHAIDAARHFDADVEACLLVCELEPGASSRECAVHAGLGAERTSVLALRDGALVADLAAHERFGHLRGASPLRWRSGIKHDAARVMELVELDDVGDGRFTNGFGETIAIEPTHVFPLLKSSDLARARSTPRKRLLVTQRAIGEDTSAIARTAPATWAYLQRHARELDARASSIYRGRPRFAVFGVGAYAFAPWKVAVSGFAKELAFRVHGPVAGRPVVLDDTCSFLSFDAEDDARAVAALLDSPEARGFFRAFAFRDAKRPITIELLASLDLARLAAELGARIPS